MLKEKVMTMRNIVVAFLLFTVIGGNAEEAREESTEVEKMELRIQELSLQRDQISGDMFKVLKKVRRERQNGLKLDKELREMVLQIQKQQDALEARLKEKYPDLAKMMSERDELQSEYDLIRKNLFDLRIKKSEILDREKPSEKE